MSKGAYKVIWTHAFSLIISMRLFQYLKTFILAICAGIALCVDPKLIDLEYMQTVRIRFVFQLLRSEMGTVGLSHGIAAVTIMFLFHQVFISKKQAFSCSACILSFILALFRIMGMSLSTFHDLTFINGSRPQSIIAAAVFLGIWSTLYVILKILFEKIDFGWLVKKEGDDGSKAMVFLKKHFFLISALFLLIAWGIQMAPWLPGSVPYDGRYQLSQYYGYYTMNLHHPYYATMLMGKIYELGAAIGGANFGCLLYVILQSIFGAIIFAKICCYLVDKLNSIRAGAISVLFYAFVPAWWTYMQTLDKTAISFICISWFALYYIKAVLDQEYGLCAVVNLVLSAGLSCIFRNEIKYVIIPSLGILIFIAVNKKVKIIIGLVLVMGINFICNSMIINSLGLKSDNRVESLALPIQQLARYITECEDEITDEEKDIIGQVILYEGIPERYNPEIADYVKNHYRTDTTDEEMKEFIRLWIKKLKERPDIYLVATFNNMYGYTDPFYFNTQMASYQLYTKDKINEMDEEVTYSTYYFSSDLRSISTSLAYGWQKVPILSWLVNPGAYTWLGFFLLTIVLRKKKWRYAFSFVIPILITGICFVSPVNGLLRYSLPVMAVVPLYGMLGVFCYHHE